jgi:hypothetical protein
VKKKYLLETHPGSSEVIQKIVNFTTTLEYELIHKSTYIVFIIQFLSW